VRKGISESIFGSCSDPKIRAKLQEMKDVGPRDDPLDLIAFHNRDLMNALAGELSQHLFPSSSGEAVLRLSLGVMASLILVTGHRSLGILLTSSKEMIP
jgi:hypothetical protein